MTEEAKDDTAAAKGGPGEGSKEGPGENMQAEDPDEEAVARFLSACPDFLSRHPDLLGILIPPSRWSGDGIVDLQKFMLERMRTQTEDLRDGASLLISTTRANMMVQTRTHAAALALLGAKGLDDLMHISRFDLPLILDVDTTALSLEGAEAGAPSPGAALRPLAPGMVDHLLGGADQDVRLVERTGDDAQIFGETAGLVSSAAYARLRGLGGRSDGLLALGNRDPGTFHYGQSTELLTFLARVLEHCLNRWLAASP